MLALPRKGAHKIAVPLAQKKTRTGHKKCNDFNNCINITLNN